MTYSASIVYTKSVATSHFWVIMVKITVVQASSSLAVTNRPDSSFIKELDESTQDLSVPSMYSGYLPAAWDESKSSMSLAVTLT
jgi:hypothetical protein